MHPISWWIEWPAGIVRVGVAFLVAATVVAVTVRYPVVLRGAGNDASTNSDLSYSDREIAGGNGRVGVAAAQLRQHIGGNPVGERGLAPRAGRDVENLHDWCPFALAAIRGA